ncbi:MAG: ATP-dependent DNA helicase [Candidatus Woesearchaeota archaeon]
MEKYSEEVLNSILKFFPYEKVREFQEELILDIYTSIKRSQDILVHAPTGIGKTVGVLAPSLKFVEEQKNSGRRMKIFFLTSRHTQHTIVIETIRKINEKNPENRIILADIFGKKFLCGFEDVTNFLPSDFSEYCRALRADKKCHYYTKTVENSAEKRFTNDASKMLEFLKEKNLPTLELCRICRDAILCPYEIACGIAKEANVIICDYNHIFNPEIREAFLKKTGASLKDSIIIVDEAHNLPERLREMLSSQINEKTIQLALRENKRFSLKCSDYLKALIEFMISKESEAIEGGRASRFGEELIDTSELIEFLERFEWEKMLKELEESADIVRREQKRSFLGRISDFLKLCYSTREREEFIMIGHLSSKENPFSLEYFCTDPSILTKEVIEGAQAMVLMSATLEPIEMYSDILGFDYPNMKAYGNPFPQKNRLTLIIPETTTRFQMRSDVEFRRIAFHIKQVLSLIPGRAVLFFPSYSIMSSVLEKLQIQDRKLYVESQKMSKEEKAGLISKLVNDRSGVLCAVVGASFSEGIDLPNTLKCAMLIGLPLRPPDLKVMSLIQLYQERFGRGFEYGYSIPAMSKAIQSAGRCIRSSTDYAALVFLDERYNYENYKKLMPRDWKLVSTSYYEEVLKDFFTKKPSEN